MTQDIQCTTGLSCDGIITESTRDERCNMHGISDYIILFDVILTGMCFGSHISVSVREDLLTSTALVNAGRPRNLRAPANENGIIAAVE